MGSGSSGAAVGTVNGSGGGCSGVLTVAIVDLMTDWSGWEGDGDGQRWQWQCCCCCC